MNTIDTTRDRILYAAREVISRKGKRGATTREIADVAGVNEATLFRHFGRKAQLTLSVVQHFCGIDRLSETLEGLTGSIDEDLFVLGKTMFENMTAQRDLIVWALLEGDDDELIATTWRPQNAIREKIASFMADRVKRGDLVGDPPQLALAFMSFLFAHVLAKKKIPVADIYGDDDGAIRFFISVFLNGVRSK